MSRIIQFFAKEKFCRGVELIKENQKIEKIYLLYKGEAEISKQLICDVEKGNQEYLSLEELNIHNADNKFNNFKNFNHCKIGIIKPGQFIGEECLFIKENS